MTARLPRNDQTDLLPPPIARWTLPSVGRTVTCSAFLMMSKVAAKRLIDASSTLEPAERALLNLWINRGLDDDALARMTHASSSAIAARRSELVQSLSRVVGLPPNEIHASLDDLAAAARIHGKASAAQRDHAPAPAVTTATAPSTRRSRRRRRRSAIVAIAAAIVAVLVILVALWHPAPAGHGAASSSSAPAGADAAALAPLPGGPSGVKGAVTVIGQARLEVVVRGLPARTDGHYELWLYNSILDAVPIASLNAPASSSAVALPANRRSYRWLDLSFQPAGVPNHSGESVLRVALPSGAR